MMVFGCLAVLLLCLGSAVADAPTPLLKKGDAVDWWFVFKFNATSFPGCGGTAERACIFGGKKQNYGRRFSQQFVYASSKDSALKRGSGCVGDSVDDPVGATFDQVYNGEYFYVILDPDLHGCGNNSCPGPWGHSKGMVAWGETGAGFVMQVTTRSTLSNGRTTNLPSELRPSGGNLDAAHFWGSHY